MGRDPIIKFASPFLALIILTFLMAMPVWAQDSESGTIRQEVATTGVPEEEGEGVSEVQVSEDTTPIGIVQEIILTGQIVTSRCAVIRQMTFAVGDEISPRDIDRCKQRLLGFNGIYWQADITWEPAEEEGYIIVTIDLRARRTWFLSPSQAGGVIGDRNFLGTADTASLGIFIADDDYYYTVGWLDPQFLGGHNSMYVEGHILDTNASIRTDDIFSTGESYLLDRTGGSLMYRTRWLDTIGIGAGFKLEEVDAEKFGDPFRSFGTDDQFYYSGARIPDGQVGLLMFQMSGGFLNSRFFPTQGYYWDFYNEISRSWTMSDFDFTRHTLTAAYFQNIYENEHVLCGRMMYSYLTGDPPNYELLPFDWQVRGYTGGTHRGKSMLTFNFEYRFIAEPDIFQTVLFADFGRSWDGHELSLSDLEWGYGAGIRIYTAPFIPYNLLLRIDYAYGEYGEEATIGFNQFF
jgi:outer membrane protein assembly factor BamA